MKSDFVILMREHPGVCSNCHISDLCHNSNPWLERSSTVTPKDCPIVLLDDLIDIIIDKINKKND